MRKMVEYGIWNHLMCQLMPLGPVCGGGGPQDAANLKYQIWDCQLFGETLSHSN